MMMRQSGLLDSDEAVTALENIVDTIKEGYASQSSSRDR